MAQATKALKCIHDKFILHRDISLFNVLIGEEGNLMLADFGLSKQFNSSKDFKFSQKVGHEIFRAPEMRGLLNHSKDINQQAEMFSLGVLFFIIWVGDTSHKEKCLDLYIYNQSQ